VGRLGTHLDARPSASPSTTTTATGCCRRSRSSSRRPTGKASTR
jgi:hypothetical protein